MDLTPQPPCGRQLPNKGSQSPQNKKQKLQQSRGGNKKLQKRMAKGRLQEKRVKTAWLSGKVLINHH